jgi:predicted nuclease of predicted toxin-antitoxin system
VRFLLNENIPATVIHALRNRGHDVVSAKETMLGKPDKVLLTRAEKEKRLLVTQDKHFGELAFRAGLPAECGIILFRLGTASPEADSQRMLNVIENRSDWAGHFSVVTDRHIRVRSLLQQKRND